MLTAITRLQWRTQMRSDLWIVATPAIDTDQLAAAVVQVSALRTATAVRRHADMRSDIRIVATSTSDADELAATIVQVLALRSATAIGWKALVDWSEPLGHGRLSRQ